MKKIAVLLLLPLLTGCFAHCYLQKDLESCPLDDDNGKPIAAFGCDNTAYLLFACIPLASGVVWTDGPFEDYDHVQIDYFDNTVDLDHNLLCLRAALKEMQSNRVSQMINTLDESSFWSLFIVKKRRLSTTCLILEPKP